MAMTPYKEQVDARPLQRTALQPTGDPTAGRAVGAAFGALASGVARVASALDAREVLLADTEARDAYEGWARERNDLLYDPSTGLFNRKGGNGLDLVPDVARAEGDLQTKHGDSLSPRARKLFDERVRGVRLSDEEGAARYSSAQTEAYVVGGRQSTIGMEVENAALAYGDPTKFEEHLGAANREIAALGELQGWSPEQVQEEQNKATSTAVTARVLRTATDDPIAASRILDAERGRLSAAHQQQLDNALKDPVAEAQAAAVVAQYIGPPQPQRGYPAVAGPRDSTEAMIVQAESGGRTNARNPNSSAAGPHQFLSGTFVGQARKMQREGRAPWAEGLSDDELAAIRAPRNDQERALEQAVYDDFRADGQAAIKAVGAAVTPATEYIMHHFGAGGGRRILQALMGNPAALVDTVIDGAAAIRKVNPWMKGSQTVGQLVDAAARFIGADPRSTAGNYVDEAAALDGIAQIEDPLVRRKALGQLNEWMGMEQTAKESAASSAFDSAWQAYKINGTTTIPLEAQLAMGPGKLASLQATIAAERSGALSTDPEVYDLLTKMAVNDPQGFASADLRDFWPSLTEGDRKGFTDKQAAVQGSLRGEIAKNDPMLVPFEDNWTTVKDIIAPLGLKLTGEKASEADQRRALNLRQQLDAQQIEFARTNGRHPNTVEVRQMALDLTAPIILKGAGRFGGSVEGVLGDVATAEPGVTYEFDRAIADIPPAERAEIVETLAQQGIAPTTENVEKAANDRAKLRTAGGVTALDEVPEEFRRNARALTTDPDGIIALYNEWLLATYGAAD